MKTIFGVVAGTILVLVLVLAICSIAHVMSCAGYGADLAQLQSELKCGTECGSCLPELKRMVNSRSEERGARSDAIPGQVSASSPFAQSSIPNPQS